MPAQPRTLEINLVKFQNDLHLVEKLVAVVADNDAGYMIALLTEIVEFQREKGNFVDKTIRQLQAEAMLEKKPEIIL